MILKSFELNGSQIYSKLFKRQQKDIGDLLHKKIIFFLKIHMDIIHNYNPLIRFVEITPIL